MLIFLNRHDSLPLIVMRVFTGKMSYQSYATYELGVIVIPETLEANQPILAYWQWTVDSKGYQKQNVRLNTTIESSNIVHTDGGKTKRVVSFTSYYEFKLEIAVDEQGKEADELTLVFARQGGPSSNNGIFSLHYDSEAVAGSLPAAHLSLDP